MNIDLFTTNVSNLTFMGYEVMVITLWWSAPFFLSYKKIIWLNISKRLYYPSRLTTVNILFSSRLAFYLYYLMDILDMIPNICLIDGLVSSNYVMINDKTDKYKYFDDKHIFLLLFQFSTLKFSYCEHRVEYRMMSCL